MILLRLNRWACCASLGGGNISYVHPIVAVAALLWGLVVLNTGMELRKLRVKKMAESPEMRRLHIRFAQPGVAVLLTVFALGPISSSLLRQWRPFETMHGWAGAGVAICFAVNAVLGVHLKRDRTRYAAAHGVIGACGMLLGLLAALTGIELLL